MALRKFSGSDGSTNLTVMPSFGSVCRNKFQVPPYKLVADTISSPAWAMVKMA